MTSMLKSASSNINHETKRQLDLSGCLFFYCLENDLSIEVERELTPASNLAFYRKLMKMTQEKLAEKLGTRKQVISDMEHGRRAISKATAKELSKIFSVSTDRFI